MLLTRYNSWPNTSDAAILASKTAAQLEKQKTQRAKTSRPAIRLLPRRYELANPRDIVELISSMLTEVIQYNDNIPLRTGHNTKFHSQHSPSISVHDYLQRLTIHVTLSPSILLTMVYYMDKLCAAFPSFVVSTVTVHRFLLASARVASKCLADNYWTNRVYALIGGVSVDEVALLELELLRRLDWRIVPQPEVLVDYYNSLVGRYDVYKMEPEEGTGNKLS